ncbi:MAG: T9SS type A sorting domain-containing protein [Bacteroidia bacterium]|nr:T9SS type A sorting domain-containing protein [Bacteroidia bacterium]MBP9922924.1 T9SS type A sorting domain-containing protein [Bacteroidia bacterium]
MRNRTIFICLFLLLNYASIAQITYEHTYPASGSPSQAIVDLVDIGNNDLKFLYTDYSLNELRIFNLDHSPFATIVVPIQLLNRNEYSIGYVTKSLFDCDSTMFEYAIMSGIYHNNFYVFREDGSLLFQRDSVVPAYCIGCFIGSHDVRPIVNTSNGAKLFLLKADSIGFPQTVDVYSLCGSLPMSTNDLLEDNQVHVKIFPNPGRNEVNFQFELLESLAKYEITIYSPTTEVIFSKIISASDLELNLNTISFSSGSYFFTLKSKNKILQTGKFIIVR